MGHQNLHPYGNPRCHHQRSEVQKVYHLQSSPECCAHLSPEVQKHDSESVNIFNKLLKISSEEHSNLAIHSRECWTCWFIAGKVHESKSPGPSSVSISDNPSCVDRTTNAIMPKSRLLSRFYFQAEQCLTSFQYKYNTTR